MKHADIIFQFLLFVITALLAIAVPLTMKSDAVFFAFGILVVWTIALFICQGVHSFTIALAFWNRKGIRIAMRVYWIALGLYVLFLLLRDKIFSDDSFSVPLAFPILPALIAIYFWCVTVYFWFKELKNGSSNEQRNGILNRLSRFLNKTP
ncbi:MAG TPA: hypothetical protein VHM26_02335 [Chitinophagaceae bacterium]|jgi:hypothetical protein|nr:hypothetical protein [Chitinophagaceae bacterium]